MLTSNPACAKPSEEAESFKALRKLSQSSVPGPEEKSSCFAAVSPPQVEKGGFSQPVSAFSFCCWSFLIVSSIWALVTLPGVTCLGDFPFSFESSSSSKRCSSFLRSSCSSRRFSRSSWKAERTRSRPPFHFPSPSTAEGSNQPLQEQGTPLEREQAPHFCS